jgi:hypothetical protein
MGNSLRLRKPERDEIPKKKRAPKSQRNPSSGNKMTSTVKIMKKKPTQLSSKGG